MRYLAALLFLSFSIVVDAQSVIDWSDDYELHLSDFQSSASQIGGTAITSLQAPLGIEFQFYMSRIEFMMTKNFNSKVACAFNRSAMSLVATDSVSAMNLLAFAQYQFDLSELYARKFRKKIFEEKNAFSGINFCKPLHEEMTRELTERNTIAGKLTDLGRNRQALKQLHDEVIKEIATLPDFCKSCKPEKRKK